MIIAQEKRRENIVEYLLYMFHIEDLIRGHNFDLEAIEKNIVAQFDIDDEQYDAMVKWYDNLIRLMKNEKVSEKGHISALNNLIRELTELHMALINSPYHSDYVTVYEDAAPYILELFGKVKEKNKSIIEIALDFLYGILILRLKKKEISKETTEAQEKISKFMAMLAKKYKQYETDEDFYT